MKILPLFRIFKNLANCVFCDYLIKDCYESAGNITDSYIYSAKINSEGQLLLSQVPITWIFKSTALCQQH